MCVTSPGYLLSMVPLAASESLVLIITPSMGKSEKREREREREGERERERERRYECGPSINLHLSLSVFTYPISFPLLLMAYFNWFTKTRKMSIFNFESLSLSVLWPQA